MPTTYAHYRFGCDVIALMPEQLKSFINENRPIFDFGVHGPDLLFYYLPLFHNTVNRRGSLDHCRSGREFFQKAARAALGSTDPDAARCYLLGVLCHFMLDRECHPYVAEKEKSGASHSEIEASFDAYLMEKDGLDPLRHNVTAHLHPSWKSAMIISDFYKPITPGQIHMAQQQMVLVLKGLIPTPGVKQTLLDTAIRVSRDEHLCDLFIKPQGNPACRDSDEILYDHYQEALGHATQMILELGRLMDDGSPLGDRFDHTFGAE